MSNVEIACPAGTITGYQRGEVNYFHSIDYSLIPGDFEDPQPAPPRDQDARTPRPEAIALSITAPAEAHDAPVVVYIHGGRYEHGTHEDARAEGTTNAEAGIVQVQLGYRVGLAGLARFADDEADHYRAIEDLQLGLEWVQSNIEAFGGDPTNVTVLGQSAGANAALWLARRDHYRGAFRRLIALSPGFPRERFEVREPALREALGVPVTRESLAAMDSEKLAAGYRAFRKKYTLDMALGPAPLDCSQLAEIPIVLGTTRDEFYAIPATQKVDKSFLRKLIVRHYAPRFGLSHNAFESWYQIARYLDKERPMGRLVGDSILRRWAVQVAEEAPGPTWMIEFVGEHSPALHCAELPLLFGVDTGEPARVLNGWLQDFLRHGEPGFEQYRPDHALWEFALDTGAQRMAHGSLDYISAAFGQGSAPGLL
ncbi:carboxylesterase family protein [Corynebacterium sp.]|uniref:carboxylesterase family protein n=1 Tax=Corynebacterium sp. TaxID=1720 RepID=UPI0026DC0E7B|nr:carboxylesterase family protein [Corynebacterium sp.]MDO5031054.1 carboxylesterase family protein [Corynebacterium sp.]